MLSLEDDGDTHCPSWFHTAIHLSPTFQLCFSGIVSEPLVVEALSVGCEVRRSFVKSITSCREKMQPKGGQMFTDSLGNKNW